jgi:LPS export ABC transporter protein LptC
MGNEIFPKFAVGKYMRNIWIIALLAFTVWGCTHSEEEEATLDQMQKGTPIKEAFQVRFTFSENAVMQAELEAPHAIESKENDQDVRIFDKGLHLVFYTPQGVQETDLKAQNGKFRNQFNDAEVWGDVVMINSKGDQLSTQHLWWNKTLNRIHTDRNLVKIITPTEIIYGDSLDANTDFTEYKIFNINGAVNIKEGDL